MKQIVIHSHIKKKDVKFDIKGPTEYEKQMKMWKRANNVENIATGETSQAITPFHFFDYFHFFGARKVF